MGGNSDMQQMVRDRMRFARLRLIGTRRNVMYRDGQGNITAALALAGEELALMQTPEILADMGVMLTMLAEDKPALFQQAVLRYGEAQDVAYRGWVQSQRQQWGMCAGDDAGLPGVMRDWVESPGVTLLEKTSNDYPR